MERKLAVVTGASSGIGEALSEQLGERGYDLVLCARREKKLLEVSERLSRRFGVSVHVVTADLARPSGVDDLIDFCERLSRPVDLLVNNAGFGSYGAFATLDHERELEMIDLNVRALVALTSAFLPGMLARDQGAIMQIASTTSFQPVPYMATYAATKAFVLSFSEALALEYQDTNVRMLAVCPGHTPTEFQQISGVNRRPTRTSAQSAAEVAQEALAALDSPDVSMVVTGWPNRVTTLLPKLLPRSWFGKVVERAFRPRS